MKNVILALIIIFTTQLAAQIQHPGTPLGKPAKSLRSSSHAVISLPPFTPMERQQEEPRIAHKTLTFAHPFEVNITPNNAGQWHTSADGQRIWHVSIYSKNAASLNLIFSKFKLPEGGKLFIYNQTMSHIIGAFTHENNKASGVLPTLPVQGDYITVEYQAPLHNNDSAELCIGTVNHDFYGIYEKMGNFGDAAICEKDISCYPDDNYQISQRSTVKLIIDGSELMTGTLINNSKEDGTPYIITAAHGYRDYNMNAASTLFIFNYQAPHCFPDIEGSREQAIAGGEMLCYSPYTNDHGVDFALLKMSANPPSAYRPAYAGWSHRSEAPAQIHCVHHPMGDVKKISFDNDSLVVESLAFSNKRYKRNAHWRVKTWEVGTTEGGSSGAAIFNAKSQFLGGLSGGAATCNYPRNDYFFRFDVAWDALTNTDSTLSQWLDSNNSGIEEIDYYIPEEVRATQQLSHITPSSDITSVIADNVGNIAGNNTLGITRFVEKFEHTDSASIYGFYFVPAEGTSQSYVNISIWNGDTEPETEIYSEPLLIKQWSNSFPSSIAGNTGGYYNKTDLGLKENFVQFAKPVKTDGNFFIGFEVDNDQAHSPFSMTLSHTAGVDHAFYFDDAWHPYSALENYNKASSLWIEPIVKSNNYNTKLASTTHTDELMIWPNPINNHQQLKIEGIHLGNIAIYTIDGKRCHCNSQQETTVTTLDTRPLKKGTYILKVEGKAHLFIKH